MADIDAIAKLGIKAVLTSCSELNIPNAPSIAAAIEPYSSWAIINAAGFVRTWVTDARFDECLTINVIGRCLAGHARRQAYARDLLLRSRFRR